MEPESDDLLVEDFLDDLAMAVPDLERADIALVADAYLASKQNEGDGMPKDTNELHGLDAVNVAQLTDDERDALVSSMQAMADKKRRDRLDALIAEGKAELAERKKRLAAWQKDGLLRKVERYQQNVEAKEAEVAELIRQKEAD